MTDKEKVLTPIVDRVIASTGSRVEKTARLITKARELEEIAEELSKQLNLMLQFTPKWADVLLKNNCAALARYQAMKEKAK